MEIDFEFALRIFISLVVGAVVGFEREYQSKPAGLRTMIMICMGSTILTELSLLIPGNSNDRIASTIITGIGFLGAGVIFKDNMSVNGLTTATTIWVVSALGMAIGLGEYFIALVGVLLVLSVLSILQRFEIWIAKVNQVRSYRVGFNQDEFFKRDFDEEISKLHLKFHKQREHREGNAFVLMYDVSGKRQSLERLNEFLKKDSRVLQYQY